jgi:predicted DNA-binding transcriptional regulator YafY
MKYIDPSQFSGEFSEAARLAMRRWESFVTAEEASSAAIKIRKDAASIAKKYPRYASWISCKALSWIAIAYEKRGQVSNAIRTLRAILRKRSIDPYQRTIFYLNLGNLYIEKAVERRRQSAPGRRGLP